jgi:hypothetical protein
LLVVDGDGVVEVAGIDGGFEAIPQETAVPTPLTRWDRWSDHGS